MNIGYAGAFIGGILTLLSPCSVMLLPAFFAYAFGSPTRLFARTGIFYVGLVSTLIPIGVLAGSVGALFAQNRTGFVVVAALVIVLLGAIQLSGLNFPAFTRGDGADGTSKVSVYLLGTVYGVAGICTGPILGSVLTVAAIGGTAVYGGILLASYALGMVVPLIVLALVWNRTRIGTSTWLRPRQVRIGRWQNSWLMIVSGLLSIGLGVFLLLTDGTASFGGILTISDEYAAENWVLNSTSWISNGVFSVLALLAVTVVAVGYTLRSRRIRRQRDNRITG